MVNEEKTIKYTSHYSWNVALVVVALIITTLMGLLFWEYRTLRTQTDKVFELQEQYYGYVDTMKKVLRKKKVDEGLEYDQEDDVEDESTEGDDDDLEVDSFIVINRAPSYLKKSTVEYLKEQRLESLLSRMNLSEWQNYTDQVLESTAEKKTKRKRNRSKQKRGTSSYYAQRRWIPMRRDSLTGIEFAWPIEKSGFWLSSFFGARKKPNGRWGFHYGIDMAAPRGTAVRASAGGVVEFAGHARGYGNTIVIKHDGTYKTRYAHLDAIYVREQKHINAGDKIGAVGDTGYTIKSGKDASHLHFELYEHGKQINPLYLLPR